MNHYENLERLGQLKLIADHTHRARPMHDEMVLTLLDQGESQITVMFDRKLGTHSRRGVRVVVLAQELDGLWRVSSESFLARPAETESKNGYNNSITPVHEITGIHFLPGTGPAPAPFGTHEARLIVSALLQLGGQ